MNKHRLLLRSTNYFDEFNDENYISWYFFERNTHAHTHKMDKMYRKTGAKERNWKRERLSREKTERVENVVHNLNDEIYYREKE